LKYIIKASGGVGEVNSTVELALLNRIASLEADNLSLNDEIGDLHDDIIILQNKLSDTGWIPLPLLSGFVNYSTDSNGPPSYRIKNDILYLKGSIAASSGNLPVSGQIIFTSAVPDLVGFTSSGYSGVMAVGPTGGTLGRLYLESNGSLRYGGSKAYGNGSMSYLTLSAYSGIHIRD
jgi:hypothetical protein